MRAVIQRVSSAEVRVGDRVTGAIEKGAVVLLAVARDDEESDVDYLTRKCAELRMFADAQGKMNLSAAETSAGFLVVSQFTLLADCRKGRRPSFDRAAQPPRAEAFYNMFVDRLRKRGFTVATGEFQAMMDVALVNDGPVTFVLDSREGR